jgi:hypothetical protein
MRQLQLTNEGYASGKFGEVIVPYPSVKTRGLVAGVQAPSAFKFK